MSLRFLHISDIHFRKYNDKSQHWDLDIDIRNEIERDLAVFREQKGIVNAILVGGDVAFSGKPEEYDTADTWLKKLSSIVGCELENILTIPGNHDVDRSKIGAMLEVHHQHFRNLATRQKIDPALVAILGNVPDANAFFGPFENYSNFAAKYGSVPTEGNRLFWEKDFAMSGIKVRIRGVNSALISNKDDNEHTHKLFLGSIQTNIQRENSVINILMCHHPPEWLYDNQEAHRDLIAKCSVQLFGHVHKENTKKVDESLILSAGAMQPSRFEDGWNPCYNIIDLDITENSGVVYLQVSVWKRFYDKDKLKFVAKFTESGSPFESFSIKTTVNQLVVKGATGVLGNDFSSKLTPSAGLIENNEVELINVNKKDYIRQLAYLFLSLPYHKRIRIAVGLELTAETDEQLPELKKSQLYFKRAQEGQKLKQLWDEIYSLNPDLHSQSNPF